MSNTSATIQYDSGTASFDPAGPFTLEKGGTLTVSLGSGFSSGSAITELQFFHWDPDAPDGKGSLLGTWANGESSGLDGIYSVTGSGNPVTQVVIEDLEDPNTEDDFALEVSGDLGGGGSWDTDPELINKPGG